MALEWASAICSETVGTSARCSVSKVDARPHSRHKIQACRALASSSTPRAARTGAIRARRNRLARTLGNRGVLREAHWIDELYRIAEDFQRLEIDVLGISGGDGTNHVTLTGFIDVYKSHTPASRVLARRHDEHRRELDRRAARKTRRPPRVVRCAHTPSARCDRSPTSNATYAPRHDVRIFVRHRRRLRISRRVLSRRRRRTVRDIAARTLLNGVGSALVGGEIVRIAAPFIGHVEQEDGRVEKRPYSRSRPARSIKSV